MERKVQIAAMEGKTVKSATRFVAHDGNDVRLVVEFTDGTVADIESKAFPDASSALVVNVAGAA